MTTSDVLTKLTRGIDRAGSLRRHAIALGISAAYLSDVMNGKREPGRKLLTPMGLTKHVTVNRTVTYHRSESPRHAAE